MVFTIKYGVFRLNISPKPIHWIFAPLCVNGFILQKIFPRLGWSFRRNHWEVITGRRDFGVMAMGSTGGSSPVGFPLIITRCIFYLTPDMTLYDRQRLGTWGHLGTPTMAPGRPGRSSWCTELLDFQLESVVWVHIISGYGSIPIHTIFRGMNIHLPAILMFTRGIGFWPIPIPQNVFFFLQGIFNLTRRTHHQSSGIQRGYTRHPETGNKSVTGTAVWAGDVRMQLKWVCPKMGYTVYH